jgi:hypothetical protein
MDWNPSERKLRQFAWAWLAFVAILWPAIAVMRGHRVTAEVALAVGLVGWQIGVARPALLKWPFVLLSLVTWPIGQVVGRLAMVVVFFLVITPMGLVQRLSGRDPMGRRFDATAASYWRPRKPSAPDRYLRQS